MRLDVREAGALIERAFAARERAYAPYSHFKVGAAVLAASGQVYAGANVENASYGATMCAERCAVFAAVNAGERKLRAIALCGGREAEGVTDYCPPCGLCRQVLREFCEAKSFEVIVAKSIEDYRVFTLEELLPQSFGPENL